MPAPAGAHTRHELPRQNELGREIDAQRLLERLHRRVLEARERERSRVVHEDVGGGRVAKLGAYRREGAPHRLEIGEVALDRGGVVAHLMAHARKRVGGAGDEEDAGAGTMQGARALEADATRRPGDDGRPAVERPFVSRRRTRHSC